MVIPYEPALAHVQHVWYTVHHHYMHAEGCLTSPCLPQLAVPNVHCLKTKALLPWCLLQQWEAAKKPPTYVLVPEDAKLQADFLVLQGAQPIASCNLHTGSMYGP